MVSAALPSIRNVIKGTGTCGGRRGVVAVNHGTWSSSGRAGPARTNSLIVEMYHAISFRLNSLREARTLN